MAPSLPMKHCTTSIGVFSGPSELLPALRGIAGGARIVAITDANVRRSLGGILGEFWAGVDAVVEIPAGEENKNVETLADVWRALGDAGATRRSLAVNIGGGVVTDLGGFAAATFKRGIRFVNVPTTVLGAADAAVGGKTGIDIGPLKNEAGAFAPAEKVVYIPALLDTLPPEHVLSGMAEVMKTAALVSREWWERLLRWQPGDMETVRRGVLMAMRAKERIVALDPKESGLRRVLNLGHTAGHAYESLGLQLGCPIPHGHAVAHGMAAALRLSVQCAGFPPEEEARYRRDWLGRLYPPLPFDPQEHLEALEALLLRDKKNTSPSAPTFIALPRIAPL